MKHLLLAATLGLSFTSFASVNSTYFESLDVKSIHDQEVMFEQKGVAPRFAVAHEVSIEPVLEKSLGGYTWTHQVTAPNAVSLNFGFSEFYLPEGAELNIYSADRTQFIRTFTAADNNSARQLWTPVIMTDDAIIELTAPAEVANKVELKLAHVGQGFRTFGQTTTKSGSCNIDVACTDSRGWEKEINSVAVISTGGSRFCTGFMVNNTKNDKTPFFMTANHCRITADAAPTLVTYWNYQTSKCKGPRDGRLDQFQTGSTFLAAASRSDFTLVRLNQAPKAEWNVTYAGWDATGAVGTSSTVIHHPNVDEKSISFASKPTQLSAYGGTSSPGDSTHVWVVDYDKGTTEPGSSGSPLFNDKHRVIGQLHGGGAACGNDLSDYYGRFSMSYQGDGTASGSLKNHLDPAKTGQLTTDTI
ncbi:MAG: trypsin-like serine peptidase [Bacteriovoracaceae bacterium]